MADSNQSSSLDFMLNQFLDTLKCELDHFQWPENEKQNFANFEKIIISEFSQRYNRSIENEDVYYLICLIAIQEPRLLQQFMPILLAQFEKNRNTLNNETPLQKSLYEICPITFILLYFVENFLDIKTKDKDYVSTYLKNELEETTDFSSLIIEDNKEFIFYFYQTFYQIFYQTTQISQLYQVACIKILTYALIWCVQSILTSSNDIDLVINEEFINLHSKLILHDIKSLLVNSYQPYSIETGIECFLMLLRNDFPKTLLKKFIPILIQLPQTESYLSSILKCINYLLPYIESNEYKVIISSFLINLDFKKLSNSNKIDFLFLMSTIIQNGKFGYYPINLWFQLGYEIFILIFEQQEIELIDSANIFLNLFINYLIEIDHENKYDPNPKSKKKKKESFGIAFIYNDFFEHFLKLCNIEFLNQKYQIDAIINSHQLQTQDIFDSYMNILLKSMNKEKDFYSEIQDFVKEIEKTAIKALDKGNEANDSLLVISLSIEKVTKLANFAIENVKNAELSVQNTSMKEAKKAYEKAKKAYEKAANILDKVLLAFSKAKKVADEAEEIIGIANCSKKNIEQMRQQLMIEVNNAKTIVDDKDSICNAAMKELNETTSNLKTTINSLVAAQKRKRQKSENENIEIANVENIENQINELYEMKKAVIRAQKDLEVATLNQKIVNDAHTKIVHIMGKAWSKTNFIPQNIQNIQNSSTKAAELVSEASKAVKEAEKSIIKYPFCTIS